jgi:hypothetical protein
MPRFMSVTELIKRAAALLGDETKLAEAIGVSLPRWVGQ